MKNKFNIWDNVVMPDVSPGIGNNYNKALSKKEKSVRFESAIARGGVISKEDHKDVQILINLYSILIFSLNSFLNIGTTGECLRKETMPLENLCSSRELVQQVH